MKLKALLITLAAVAVINVSAQQTTKLTASKANNFGLAYTLPKTVFDIVIETEYTLVEPGEFENFAELYLMTDDVVRNTQRTARVKSVHLIPRGVSDPDNRWMVELKGGVTYMVLNGADVPVAINYDEEMQSSVESLPTAVAAKLTPLETEAAKHAMTRDMLAATSQSKRAALAAQRIFELRQMRSDLISGQAENTPPDGQSMQLALDNLAAQEAALTAMFVGTEKTWTQVNTIEYVPGDESVTDMVIARLSPADGLVDANNLAGAPIYLDFEVLTTGELPTDPNGAPKKAPKDGIAYTIPGSGVITVKYDGSKLLSRRYDIAQLGKTFFLDPKIFTDKKAPAYVIFDTVTGGIATLGTKTVEK